MKSIKIYLLPLFLFIFFSIQVFSQDEFYNDKKETEKIEQTISKTDSIIVYGYFTEKDYNEIHGIQKHTKNTDSELYYGDEIYNEEPRKGRRRDGFLAEVAAEVIVEVVINAVFIIATFWQ